MLVQDVVEGGTEPRQPPTQIECIDLERQHRVVDRHGRWRPGRCFRDLDVGGL